jgi:hypothetical protein
MSHVTVIEPRADVAPSLPTAVTPLAMLSQAVERGADVAVLEKLMALHERWEANQARKAFDAAIVAAKGEIPAIVKDQVVDFPSKRDESKKTNYKHESFAKIAKVVDPILNKHGLSYRFRTRQEAKRLSVTCILSHVDGHSEETTLQADEDHTGNKNSIQAIGSTVQYLMRYTLKPALGLSVTNDDDGRAAGNPDVITDEQADTIRDLLTRTNANIDAFLAMLKVECIPDIPAARYDYAIGKLSQKLAAMEKEAAQ